MPTHQTKPRLFTGRSFSLVRGIVFWGAWAASILAASAQSNLPIEKLYHSTISVSRGSTSGSTSSPPSYVEGEVMVHYLASFAPLSKTSVPMALGATDLRELPHIGWHRLKLPGGMTTSQAIKLLSSTAGVDRVEPNYTRHITQFVPTDPYYSLQYGPQLIGCPYAWELTLGTNTVTIGFVDTGIDLPNTEFLNRIKIVSGSNIIAGNNSPQDDNDHGTHVAGIATAAIDNGVGIAGVDPKAEILPIKALDASGSGSIAQIAEGYMMASDGGADIVNASLGGNDASQTEIDAVNYVLKAGKIFVAAAGNSGDQGNQLFYPAAYPGVIGVGAVDKTSTYQSWSQYGSWVKVAAPGVSIYSTYPGGTYAYDDGTSMASPHVAAALALLKSYAATGTTSTQLENALFAGCVSVGSGFCQYGLINIPNSMALLNSAGTITTTTPYAASGYFGSVQSGNAASLAAADGNDLVITGGSEPDTTVTAGFASTYLLTQNVADLTGLGFSLVATANSTAEGYAYVYNFFKGRYDLISQFAFTSGTVTTILPFASIKPYLRGGELRVIFLANQQLGPPLILSVDKAVIQVTSSSSS